MKIASVSETKNGLSALLDQVKQGNSILITDRGVPIARLIPPLGKDGSSQRLARLERAGLVRRGRGRRLAMIANEPPPTTSQPIDLLEILRNEREDRL